MIIMNGIAKWYNVKKGYGFIKGEDGQDVFAHRADLSYFEVYLEKGDLTKYKIEKTKNGNKAKDIIVKNRLTTTERMKLS